MPTEKSTALPPDREYFTAIETAFIRRRGTPFLLSPKDFALMREWRALGIPVEAVVAGIGEAFDRREERGAVGKINSLAYCRDAVLTAWDRYGEASVGRGEGRREETPIDIAGALADLGERLKAADREYPRLREAIERARASLDRLNRREKSTEQVEDSLLRIEKALLEWARQRLSAAEEAALEGEVDRMLAAARVQIDAGGDERTRRVLLRRLLRDRFGLPRLTLLGSS